MNVKLLSKEVWYGQHGCCDVCGDTTNLIPRAVRFWDPDDGWRVGVLCLWCTKDREQRGPKPQDYAYAKRNRGSSLDAIAEICGNDMDAMCADLEDLPL